MSVSRVKNTKRNIAMAYLNMVIVILAQFLSRTLIIKTLGSEYLGLTSFFTSILQILSLADLGFASAITYNLYKPLAEKNDNKVRALLAYFKKVYRVIGTVVLVIGLIIMPFLGRLINGEMPANTNFCFLYLLYLFNTAISYFVFAYKTTLLEALQRNDIVKNIHSVVSVAQLIIQIFVLLVLKNFYLFLVVQILGTFIRNVLAEYISSKKYPQFFCEGDVDYSTKMDVISRAKGLLVCNISGKTYTTLDSIIISTFIGLNAVAIYNNYLAILTAVTACIMAIRGAMQASIGNKVATQSIESNYQDLFLWQFLFAALVTWFSTCMLCMYQPFMVIWMGKEMLLPMIDVVLLCLWVVISEIQHPFFLYLSANGLWWELKYPYIFSTIQNLVLNIFLGKLFGITGIIVSSILASLIFGLIWQCLVIFREYFRCTPWYFYKKQALYLMLNLFIAFFAKLACDLVSLNGVSGLIIRFIICSSVVCVFYFGLFHNSYEFKRTIGLLKNNK